MSVQLVRAARSGVERLNGGERLSNWGFLRPVYNEVVFDVVPSKLLKASQPILLCDNSRFSVLRKNSRFSVLRCCCSAWQSTASGDAEMARRASKCRSHANLAELWPVQLNRLRTVDLTLQTPSNDLMPLPFLCCIHRPPDQLPNFIQRLRDCNEDFSSHCKIRRPACIAYIYTYIYIFFPDHDPKGSEPLG
jgi:hypothetical protein